MIVCFIILANIEKSKNEYYCIVVFYWKTVGYKDIVTTRQRTDWHLAEGYKKL